MGDRDIGADGDLHDPAVLADLLRDVRAHLRGDADSRLRRLHAGLPRHGRRAVRHGRVRDGLRLLAVDRDRVVRRRPTPTASRQRPSTTPTSDSPIGFALGLATAAWMEPYWGGAYYHPATGAAIRAAHPRSANVYGHWGAQPIPARASWYAGGGVGGHDRERQLLQQPHGHVRQLQRRQTVQRRGPATARAATTAPPTARPAAPAASRAQQLPTTTPDSARPAQCRVRRPAPAAAPTTAPARRPPGRRATRTSAGARPTNANTGKTNTWGTASVGNNHYADVNGNVYKNTGDGWQQHSSSGWSSASGASSWGDKRIAGAQYG